MEAEVKSTSNLKDTVGIWVQNGCAVIIICAFVGLIFISTLLKTEILNKDVVNIMTGALGTMTVQIVSYWFGSSKGSDAKSDHVTALLSKAIDNNSQATQ